MNTIIISGEVESVMNKYRLYDSDHFIDNNYISFCIVLYFPI